MVVAHVVGMRWFDHDPSPELWEAVGQFVIEEAIMGLKDRGILVTPVRTDEHTAERSMFFIDRDGFPLALFELNVSQDRVVGAMSNLC